MQSDPEKNLWPDEQPEKLPRHDDAGHEKEKNNILHESKRLEAELAMKLEEHEMDKEREEAEIIRRDSEAPRPNPELPRKDHRYAELEKAFAPFKTDHIRYDFLRGILPNFVRISEESRLGRSFTKDTLGLALGITDSLASTVKLGGHMILDAGEVLIRPRVAWERTKSMIS